MKVIMAAGGTGGHIYPAIAIADELKRRYNAEILFVGQKNRLEATLVPKAGYEITFIRSGIFHRKNLIKNIRSVYRFTKALCKSRKIVKEFKPDIVIGTGGYISAPTVMAAQQLGIKTAIHEQNAFLGIATRTVSKKADVLFLSFDKNANNAIANKTVVTGNPVRADFLKGNKETARKNLKIDARPLIYISGGSQGSGKINYSLVDFLEQKENRESYNIILSTGTQYYDQIIEEINKRNIELSSNIRIIPYADNVPEIMTASDLAIARSGAITLAEIAFMGLPSILIPSPNVTDNHQYFNAKAFSDANAAVLITEDDFSSNSLEKALSEIFGRENGLAKMSKSALTLAKPNALKDIVDEIEKLL